MLHMRQRHGDDSGIEQDHKEPDHERPHGNPRFLDGLLH